MKDLAQPGPAHERLHRFVGRWSGTEHMAPSQWGPGGTAIGRSSCRRALDGLALIQEYEQEKEGQIVFHGHGVMLVEPDTQDVLWWWFDSMGMPPIPARGRWNDDVLVFENTTPMGDARYTYALAGDGYRFTIENRFPGQTDFAEFMHGDYMRDQSIRD